MKVLVDTNVLFSSLIFPNSIPSYVLKQIADNHDIFLCQQNIDELRRILARKAPEYLDSMDTFLASLPFSLLPKSTHSSGPIRDEADQPIIDAAVEASIDVIVTGDKDFLAMGLSKPECITPREYIEKYVD